MAAFRGALANDTIKWKMNVIVLWNFIKITEIFAKFSNLKSDPHKKIPQIIQKIKLYTNTDRCTIKAESKVSQLPRMYNQKCSTFKWPARVSRRNFSKMTWIDRSTGFPSSSSSSSSSERFFLLHVTVFKFFLHISAFC